MSDLEKMLGIIAIIISCIAAIKVIIRKRGNKKHIQKNFFNDNTRQNFFLVKALLNKNNEPK